MTITSKFPGTCTACHGHISAGTQIEWAKGQGARHVTCPASRTAAPKSSKPRVSRPRRQAFPATAPADGAIRIQGRRDGRGDERYTVGDVLHAPKVREAGGGPDGHYYVVICSQLCPPCEDAGWYDWTEHAWVRPATDVEAAPRAARDTAKALREMLARDLAAAPAERDRGVRMPDAATVLVPRDTSKLCATGERVAVVDGAILHERVGDPDMCDSRYHYVVRLTDASPELLARVTAFCATAQA